MQFDYSVLRELADSWGLVLMFIFFAGAVAWAMRPNAMQVHEDAASIPFKED